MLASKNRIFRSPLNKDYYILLSLVESIDKILRYSENYSNAEDFNNSERDFDATMMNFVVIGEIIDKLSDELINNNSQIDWIRIKGLRNIIAHNYFGINVDSIWQIIINDIPKFKLEISEIIK